MMCEYHERFYTCLYFSNHVMTVMSTSLSMSVPIARVFYNANMRMVLNTAGLYGNNTSRFCCQALSMIATLSRIL